MNFVVEHIGLPARDAAGLRDWYVSKLGAECLAPTGGEPPFFIRPPGSAAMFEIYQATGENPAVTQDNGLAGWRHMAIRVESLEAARAVLEARGVTFIEPVKPAAGGGRILFFKDAEGNLLHLVDRPADTKIR